VPNQQESTQTDQELNTDLCVERLASSSRSPEMSLFLAAQDSENSHRFLTFGDTQGNTTCTLLCQQLIICVKKNFLTSRKLRVTKTKGTTARCAYN